MVQYFFAKCTGRLKKFFYHISKFLTNFKIFYRNNNFLTKVENSTENQQKLTNQLNSLLEASANSLLCGPDCQREQNLTSLRQKYLDAQTNVQIAPLHLEESRKKVEKKLYPRTTLFIFYMLY